jgi:hypothetical protein
VPTRRAVCSPPRMRCARQGESAPHYALGAETGQVRTPQAPGVDFWKCPSWQISVAAVHPAPPARCASDSSARCAPVTVSRSCSPTTRPTSTTNRHPPRSAPRTVAPAALPCPRCRGSFCGVTADGRGRRTAAQSVPGPGQGPRREGSAPPRPAPSPSCSSHHPGSVAVLAHRSKPRRWPD